MPFLCIRMWAFSYRLVRPSGIGPGHSTRLCRSISRLFSLKPKPLLFVCPGQQYFMHGWILKKLGTIVHQKPRMCRVDIPSVSIKDQGHSLYRQA